jgi:hypothetical protein
MLELACDDLVFHFNKKHLENSAIPMWVIKARGESYYVNHVDAMMPWSTKETPDNPHTKGSLKFRNCYCCITEDNNAIIRDLTDIDKARIRAKDKGHTRIIYQDSQSVQDYFKNHDIKHTPAKVIYGSCGSTFYICDIIKQSEATFAILGLTEKIRTLRENETYWKAYDDNSLRGSLDADEINPTTFNNYDEDY